MTGYGYLADFHTHTRASDGRGSAQDLLRLATEKGMSAVAVTDHDALDEARWCYGFARHQETMRAAGPKMVAGVELSARIVWGEMPDVVHVLGLGIDPFACAVSAVCDELAQMRATELERRLDHAGAHGFSLGPEAQGRVRESAFWGKQEIARELVLEGRFETVDDAYHALWDDYDVAYDTLPHVAAERALAAIHDAGGIAVLAHPLRDETRSGSCGLGRAVRRIDALVAMGLDGVECYYRTFSLEACEALDAVARARHLLVSCGSDHHDFGRRMHLGVTCADGGNYAYRSDVADALGIA